MKKKILGEIITIVFYMVVMILCIVALPYVEEFAYGDTMRLFVTQCLATIFMLWSPMMILIAISEIRKNK